jgi:hypothetical protein
MPRKQIWGLLQLWIVLPLLAVPVSAQTANSEYPESLRFSCLSASFLSVSADTLPRDDFPDVELRLVDPSGRSAGAGYHKRRIPHSRSGKIIQIPKHPEIKAVAVEICHAIPGRYLLTVAEHGKRQYGISITGDDGKTGNESLGKYFQPDGDRVCEYRFSFSMNVGSVSIRWLDRDNRPLLTPTCDLVPGA